MLEEDMLVLSSFNDRRFDSSAVVTMYGRCLGNLRKKWNASWNMRGGTRTNSLSVISIISRIGEIDVIAICTRNNMSNTSRGFILL